MNYFAYQVVGGEGNFHVLLQVAGKNYTMYDFAKNSRNVKGFFQNGLISNYNTWVRNLVR